MATSSSLTGTVLPIIKKLFPEELADRSWDNTGLLLGEAPPTSSATATRTTPSESVLLTNDLTSQVVDEAIKENARVIICYHPVIFRPLKSLTTNDPMQTSLLRLAAERISVYCPHTAMDAAHGGINDWLCDILCQTPPDKKPVPRKAIESISGPVPQGHEGTGYGRLMELPQKTGLHTLLRRLSAATTGTPYVMVAIPPHLRAAKQEPLVGTVAVCAGSGAGVFKDVDAELLVTGEMSHHDALRHTQLGRVVATVFHSNSERRYLRDVLQPRLERELAGTTHADARVVVSAADHDPFDIVNVESLA